MRTIHMSKPSLAAMVAIVCVAVTTGVSVNAAAQFGGPRQANESPFPFDFTGDWLWSYPRQNCGSVLDSFGTKPVFGDGKKEGTAKSAGGNLNLCQFPIDELEKVMNGRGHLWLKTFSSDDAISPKWSCGVSLAGTITRSGTKTFIKRADAVVMWFENAQRGRYIYTDGRKHPPATDLFYWGHSIGWMEGKTFVVETTNFTWDPDGYDDQSHMARSHLAKWIERYTLKDKDTMEVAFIMEDPVFLKDTFRFTGAMRRTNGEENKSWECDPQSDARDIYSTFNNPYPDDNTAERFFGIK